MSYGQKGWEVQNVVLSERMQLKLRMTPHLTKLFFSRLGVLPQLQKYHTNIQWKGGRISNKRWPNENPFFPELLSRHSK